MRRNRDIKTRKIIKYKAQLNIHGGQQRNIFTSNHMDDHQIPIGGDYDMRMENTLN